MRITRREQYSRGIGVKVRLANKVLTERYLDFQIVLMVKEDKLKLIAHCGLYCPKCYKMRIADAAELLDKELESASKKGANYLKDHSSLKEILKELIDLRCIKLCREGGGKSSKCEIKICCDEHKIVGCWECPDFEECKRLKQQFVDNVKRIRNVGIEGYVKEREGREVQAKRLK